MYIYVYIQSNQITLQTTLYLAKKRFVVRLDEMSVPCTIENGISICSFKTGVAELYTASLNCTIYITLAENRGSSVLKDASTYSSNEASTALFSPRSNWMSA